MSQVGAENLTSWLKDSCAVINEGGRLAAPAKAWRKKIEQLFEEIDGDDLLQVATTLGYAQSESVRYMAKEVPDIVERLRSEEGQRAINEWFERNAKVMEEFRRQVERPRKQLPATTQVSFPKEQDENGLESKNKRGKRGPLSGASLEQELWHALKYLNDPYELDKSRLTRLKQVEALAERRYADSACTRGEILGEVVLSCIERLVRKAEREGQFSRCAQLLAEIARGSTLAEASRQIGLSREHVTRKYRPKGMEILAREFLLEVERQVQAPSRSHKP